jgi:hypothetical protein
VDGVMVGREAYHHPWLMADWDAALLRCSAWTRSRDAVELAMVDYMEREAEEDGTPWYAIARHMLGLRHGQRGRPRWRQVWSNHKLKPLPPREVWAAPLRFVSGALFSADVPELYRQLDLPVWVSMPTRGDFTDYEGRGGFEDRPGWQFHRVQGGALPYFEDSKAFHDLLDGFWR